MNNDDARGIEVAVQGVPPLSLVEKIHDCRCSDLMGCIGGARAALVYNVTVDNAAGKLDVVQEACALAAISCHAPSFLKNFFQLWL